MLETIAVIIVIILCCMGAVELCRSLVFKFFMPEKDKELIILVPVRGHDGSVEYTLRCAQSRVRWFRGRGRVICLNCGVDEETEALCEEVCKKMRNMEYKTMEAFCSELSMELQSEGE